MEFGFIINSSISLGPRNARESATVRRGSRAPIPALKPALACEKRALFAIITLQYNDSSTTNGGVCDD